MTKIQRYSSWLICAGIIILCLGSRSAHAQVSYPLYCQGPLTTSAPTPPPAGPTTTHFIWSSTGAGTQSPSPGQCAWADRAAGGLEIQSGNGNVICDNTGFIAGLAAGQYWEIGVYRDPTHNNCMRITQLVGTVNPPFMGTPALPPVPTPPSYPLYCHGALTTSAPTPSGTTTTPYVWASTGAGVQAPGPGQCAWADRTASGIEIQGGNGNVICDARRLISGLPSGQYWELGVYRDALSNNCMRVTRVVGLVSPPFSGTPALPPYVRRSIANLSAQQITSLRQGIAVMMGRNTIDPTSYRFQANIHGTYDTATTSREIAAWNQCEHGSYYFFSWHRMYLYFFERILRAASGDTNFALPYWNWGDSAQRALPIPFIQPQSGNALFIPVNYTQPDGTTTTGRPSGVNAGTSMLSSGTVDDSVAFAAVAFDSPNGNGFSFGGQIAPPEQFNSPHGELESQPHDQVHSVLAGLMGDPDTAGEDPIFWLHHANIDRLWKRWLAQGGRQDATDAAWLNTKFTFWDESGNAIQMSGQQIVDTLTQLHYVYDDDPPPPPLPPPPAPPHRIAESVATQSPTLLSVTQRTGEPTKRLELSEAPSSVSLTMQKEATSLLNNDLRAEWKRRVVLEIDDIQYHGSVGTYYEVYLDLPKGVKPVYTNANFVGNLNFFALMPHHAHRSVAGAAAGGRRDFDVTKVVAALLREHGWNASTALVTFVPRGLVDKAGEPIAIEAGQKATLGTVSIKLE
jgi:Common central domain of tyrosinase/Polyphenol oxidase middle domain